jgi:hypothetical protein
LNIAPIPSKVGVVSGGMPTAICRARIGQSLDDPAPTSARVDMVAELTRQRSELHGIEVPTPAWSSRSDWRARPFGGASHRWAIGACS